MKLDPHHYPLPITRPFVEILEAEIERSGVAVAHGVTLSFRDPRYCPETGGFHPVEVGIDLTGRLLYVTDFAYVGRPPFEELAKEIDFDFDLGLFQHLGQESPIAQGAALYRVWEQNFRCYYAAGVYEISVSPLA